VIQVLYIGGSSDGKREWVKELPVGHFRETEAGVHYSLTVFSGSRYAYVHMSLNPDAALAKLFDAYQVPKPPAECVVHGHRFGKTEVEDDGRTRFVETEACTRCGAPK